MIEFGVLYYLVFRAIKKTTSHQLPTSSHIFSFILCFLYAVSDEYHQKFIPGRHCKLMDIGFDSLGMLISRWQINRRSS